MKLSRRTFLRGIATGGVASLAGCPLGGDEQRQSSPGTDAESPSPTEREPPVPDPAGTATAADPAGTATAADPTGTATAADPTGTATSEPPQTQPAEATETPEQTAEPTPTTRAESTDSPVDLSRMDEVKVDVSPGSDVSGIVGAVDSGELLVFPSGEFAWNDTVAVTADNWGVRCHEETVFEVPAGIGDGSKAELLSTHVGESTADNFLLENLTFDSPGRAAPGFHVAARNVAHVNGLNYRMNGPLSNQWQENGLRAYAEDEDGVVVVDDYCQLNNGDLGGYADGDSRIGVWVGNDNVGTVRLRNPVLQGFPNNGCYVSRQPGKVVIEEGRLVNNNVSAVRVSGGVEVHDTTVVIDVDSYLEGPGVIEAPQHNTRGVWGDNRGAGTDGGIVENSTFVMRSYQSSSGLAAILENPKMTVRNSQFVLETDIEGVQADEGTIVVEGCDFVGGWFWATAGVGNITGSGNRVGFFVEPGDVPTEDRFICGSFVDRNQYSLLPCSRTPTITPSDTGRHK